MNKYKLVRTYPGSPELGTEVDLGKISPQTSRVGGYYGNRYWSVEIDDIKTNLEFWEKVVEKDYEILILRTEDGVGVSVYNDYHYGIFQSRYEWVKHYLKSGGWIIWSVKRLSDGEIFMVGDAIAPGVITKIKIDGEWKGGCVLEFSGGAMNISTARKKKQPLFTTEDGKEVFNGDRVVYVNNDFGINSNIIINRNYVNLGYKPCIESGGKYFLSREAAEEYVLMNKPLLTVREVLNSYIDRYPSLGTIQEGIKDLAKSKL